MTVINASPSRLIPLGYEGEDNVTQIKFRYTEEWLSHGDGTFAIRILRPGEKEPYNAGLVTNDLEKMLLTMTVTDVELSVKGSGEMQVVYAGADFVRKSPIYRYNVHRAIDEPVAPPSGSIITEIVESLADIRDDIGDLTELTTTDKSSLVSAINEVAEKGGASVTVDDALSTESENPVQNKVITGALAGKADKSLVDVLTDDVAEAKTDVGALKTTVQGKADTATVSALNDAVNGLDSDVQGLQTAVQGKADAQTVTSLSGDVDALESSVTALQTEVSGKVGDVQINGVSIVTDGVANVPIASSSALGTIRIDTSKGLSINNAGIVSIVQASSNNIKSGTRENNPVTPIRQHESAFYGLAKVAGHDEKNSTLPVGQYTDEAKVAIQKMLGIYEAPWELINEETFTNETEADYIITTDANGDAFELTDLIILFETPTQATRATKGYYGHIWCYYGDGDRQYMSLECGAWEQAANDPYNACGGIIEDKGGITESTIIVSAKSGTRTNLQKRIRLNVDSVSCFRFPALTFKKINIKAVTGTGHYQLYGKRKWQ